MKDDDVCPFHNIMAFGKTPKFKDCCKSYFNKRSNKARQTNNDSLLHMLHEPLTEKESDIIFKKAEEQRNKSRGENPLLDITNYMRIGYLDIGVVTLKIPLKHVATITDAFDHAQIYHSVLPHKWIYLGHWPMNIPLVGVMTFGDVKISPTTGVVEATGMTAHRLSELIILVKRPAQFLTFQF